MMNPGLQYPIFGPEIYCPHCRQIIPALTLTDTYLCPRHGAFEADPKTGELIHLQSGRHWRRWEGEWYRQHTHPDGIRFEIHEALD
ncbi:MAG: TIGR02652 family protein, partial [Prochloraceae cyanobacterium]